MQYRSAKRTADLLCQRLAGSTGTRVAVVDRNEIVVASSVPGAVGYPLDLPGKAGERLRVPLPFEEEQWTLVIPTPGGGQAVAAALAAELVDLWANGMPPPAATAELRNTFVYDLLQGVPAEDGEAERLAEVLGMQLTWPRAVLLVSAPDYLLRPPAGRATRPVALPDRVENLITHITAHAAALQPLCAYIGNGELAVLAVPPDLAGRAAQAPGSPGAWAALTALKQAANSLLARLGYEAGTPIAIALGRYHPGVAGLAASYSDARTALHLGRRLGGRRIYCLDMLGTAAYLGLDNAATKRDLARERLHALQADPDLLLTLTTFLEEDAVIGATADRLGIHRNTLSYRFDKIATLTGRDPRRFEHLVELRLAMLALDLLDQRGE